MATIYGSQYPGMQDGLIFAFDPKNRDCWSGGVSKITNIAMPTHSGSSDTFGAGETAELLQLKDNLIMMVMLTH